jgi:peptide/nickel transport system permease protein
MIEYTIRRLLLAVPVVLGVLVVTFILARVIPGDPCKAILGEKATKEVCDKFIKDYGLDKPIYVQLAIYLKDIAQGNFGNSIRFSRPVSTILIERLPMTIELGILAIILATVVGIFLGIISAIRNNSAIDVFTMIIANIGVSMPVYWLGLMLAYVFALLLKDTPFWLPPSGRLDAGLNSIPFYQVYHWELVKGSFSYQLAEFISNLYLFNALITANWQIFGQCLKNPHFYRPQSGYHTYG